MLDNLTFEELKLKYLTVLKLAVENADANEYCLSELEKSFEQQFNKVQFLEKCLSEINEKCSEALSRPLFEEDDYICVIEDILTITKEAICEKNS